jgi:hypothetical protein
MPFLDVAVKATPTPWTGGLQVIRGHENATTTPTAVWPRVQRLEGA